jgi:cytochrome c551/c552
MRIVSVSLALAAVLVLAGCGGNKGQQGEQAGSTTAETTSTSAGATSANWTAPADLDEGPRAADTPVDEAMASQGEKVFQTRGCVTCHAFGKKLIGPDLKGVAAQRTAKWMEAQVLHPAEMTQQDPTAKQLLAEFKTQMTNQGLSPDEARQVVEYIKKAGK